MKKIIATIFAAGFLLSCDVKTYKVELTFCDNRPNKIIQVKSATGTPDSRDIDNGGYQHPLAMPEYYGYINVCSVRTISEIK